VNSKTLKLNTGNVAYMPKFTLAQFETISALMELEGWASAASIGFHGGNMASLSHLVDKGAAEYREVETSMSAFPVREWRISPDYLKDQAS
jgi:hypothetical protein